jgi:hypothetical protein
MTLRSHVWEPITELNNTTLQKITVVCLNIMAGLLRLVVLTINELC